MSPADRPAVPTVTSAPPGDLGPGWAEAVAGVLADPSRHRLAFQPVVDLQRGTVAGYEALSRFAGPPDAGPDIWFEAAGRHGLGAELDARVLERVVGLRPELPPNCFLTVNLDPNHLVTEPVQRALAAAPALAGLVVELTEHRPVADYPTLVAAVAELRLRDAKLAVDDAGAGYAGLQHLMLLRPDLVKLDRALVAGCDRDPAKAALIEMLGRFTGQLDAWVLAEGVERVAELESLIRLRVPLAQGYLLGRPAEPWAALPDGLAVTIRDRQTAQTFEDSVVGLTVDAPAVRATDLGPDLGDQAVGDTGHTVVGAGVEGHRLQQLGLAAGPEGHRAARHHVPAGELLHPPPPMARRRSPSPLLSAGRPAG